jgi:hypothetical protein
MCQRVTCPRCGKPTFAGCGLHVEQVLRDVPSAERCQCGKEGRPANRVGTWLRKVLGSK